MSALKTFSLGKAPFDRKRGWLRKVVAVALIGAVLSSLSAGPSLAHGGAGLSSRAFNYLSSDDGGASFAGLRNLDNLDEGMNLTQVEASGGTVHALFDAEVEDQDPVRTELFYRRSADNGGSFGDPRRLDFINADEDTDDAESTDPEMAADGETLHVVWTNDPMDAAGNEHRGIAPDENMDEIFYTRSTNDGTDFEVPRNISNRFEEHERDPDVAADGDVVAVSFESDRKIEVTGRNEGDYDELENDDQVWVLVSTDGGDTFGHPIALSAGNPQLKENESAVTVSGDNIHVVFELEDLALEDEFPAASKAVYSRSTDGGATFGLREPLPGQEDDLFAEGVAITSAGSDVHVLACQVDNDELDPDNEVSLLHWHSDDDGASFDGPERIATSTGACSGSQVDASAHGDDLHVAVGFETLGEADMFHLHSNNGGTDWSDLRPLSANPGSSADPSVSVDPGDSANVHISWSDETTFLFALMHGQELPLGDGGERRMDSEDVIRYHGGTYLLVLDGSDVGLRNLRIDALAQLSENEFVLSFTESGPVPGLGRVDDADLVLFTADSLGEDTAGTFTLFLDGGDIGLSTSGEDVDAVEIDGDNLYLSTSGTFKLSDEYGELKGQDEDIFVCEGYTPGEDSSCESVSLAFDGSEVGLTSGAHFSFSSDGNSPGGSAFFSAADEGGKSDFLRCVFPEFDDEVSDEETGTNFDGDLSTCGGVASPLRTVFLADVNGINDEITAIDF